VSNRTPLETVSTMYECFASGDVEGILALTDPEIEIQHVEGLPWGGRYKGHEGVLQFIQRLLENVEARLEPQATFEAGDTVVHIARARGTARATGRSVDLPEVHLWKVRDGKIVSLASYIQRDAMLAALAA
jgi:uncharacterized protein